MEDQRTLKIRELNDQLRTNPTAQPFWNRKIIRTCGVDARPADELQEITDKVRSFNNFNEDNDPYGEHDFGAFDNRGIKYFWKIDYYNLDMSAGSEDPSDLGQTVRVLTIMRADEY